MSEPSLPSDPEGIYYTGNVYIADGTSSNNGTGSLHIANGDLLVNTGVTSLQKTYISTNTGGANLIVDGAGGIDAQVGSQILLQTSQAAANSINLNSTDAAGTISLNSAGTVGNAIDLNATAGGIDIDALTTISATAGGIMTLESTSTSSGAVTINANGNGATLVLNATGTGNDIDINATDAVTLDSATFTSTQTGTGLGAITLTSAGGIAIDANDATNGKVVVTADSTAADAIRLNATAGGVDLDAVGTVTLTTTATGTSSFTIDSAGEVRVDSTDTTNGIKIATETAGVPVTIGTASSLTTIAGNLNVAGTTTSVNTETLVVEDNLIQLNYAGGSLGIDSGVVIRRYQTSADTGASSGNVVENSTNSDTFVPQESGAFQSGSSTPGTLVLGTHASATDDFYNGWWIRVTSGSGSGQVRRIKDYVGSTKTATLYVTADNVASPVVFNDGLDLATAPAAADTYELFNQNSVALYWDESTNYYKLAGIPNSDLPGSPLLVADDTKLQYTDLNTGAIKVSPKKHRNMQGSASTTTITMTLKDVTERVLTGHKVLIEDSTGFTPSIDGTYTVTGVPTDNTFTFTVGSSTTSAAGANASVSFLNTSKISVNVIELNDPSFGSTAIPGLPLTEDITISNTSTTQVSLTSATTNTYGAYRLVVEDISTAGNVGAMATFDICKSLSGGTGNVNRTANSRGDDNQRINMDWPTGAARPRLFHNPAGSTSRNNIYRVRVYSIN